LHERPVKIDAIDTCVIASSRTNEKIPVFSDW